MKQIFVSDALKLLKEDYVLEAYDGLNRLVFTKENAQIAVYSQKYTVFVSYNDFLSIYSSFTFSPIKNKENETIDLKKDEEYYSSIQKHQ